MSRFSQDRLKAMQTIFRVREVECRQAEARLHAKTLQIMKLRAEVVELQARREVVLRRPVTEILRTRLLIASLAKLAIDRMCQLEALSLQSAVLLGEYRQARNRRDATASLQERRRLERTLILDRREDVAVAMLTASRREPHALGKDLDG